MSVDNLNRLQIEPEQKQRPKRSFWIIVLAVGAVVIGAVFLARPWEHEKSRVMTSDASKTNTQSTATTTPPATSPTAPGGDAVLTVSGYIINRARIEISPRFLGVVKWIGVKKGDAVTNGQVVVLLDDMEYQARLHEAEARKISAQVLVTKAELDYKRIHELARTDIESKEREDDARLQLEADHASLQQAESLLELARTYLGWCTIRSPINGVVLEKLVDPEELVVPQSFGGPRGPSTALIAVADPKDLQVEIDVNESDLSKISLGQKCRVTPEAYPDKHYEGIVAEIAPEADRAKGTLQIKVQIQEPDRFLTPELSAKVDFSKGQ